MKQIDFLHAVGSVDERYVEEMMQAKEHGAVTRHIRFDPAAVFGVLGGAAVCAAMVFGILAVKNGGTIKPQTATSSAEQLAENVYGTPYRSGNSDFMLSVTENSIEADSLVLNVKNKSGQIDSFRAEWYLTDGDDSRQITGKKQIDIAVPAEKTKSCTLMFDTQIEKGEYLLHLDTADRKLVIWVPYLTDESHVFDVDFRIDEDAVTDSSLTLKATNHMPALTDYEMQWEIKNAAGEVVTATRSISFNLIKDNEITLLLDWSDTEYRLSAGTYELYGEIRKGMSRLTFSRKFSYGDAGTVAASEPVMTTSTADTEVVIHFPNDPYDPDSTTTTTTAVTAPAEYNDGKVRIIAEFREQMGKAPAELTDAEGENIRNLIDALHLVPSTKSYGDAYVGELTGGCYLIYANGKRYELWNETMLRLDGQYYIMCKDGGTKGGKALVDEVIAMVTKYQP